MKKYMTAAEIGILQLKGLPTSKAAILSRAKQENWEVKEEIGLGGRRRLFIIPEKYLKSNSNIQVDDHSIDCDEYNLWAKKQDKTNIIPIRYYKDVWAGAGNGFIPFDESTDVMWFRNSFIEKYLNVNPARCACIRVRGDSMYPTLKPDGTVLVELYTQYTGEGIYLIRQGEELRIKRLQRITSEIIRILSDNKEVYPPIDLDLTTLPENEFDVLGRYLWDCGISN